MALEDLTGSNKYIANLVNTNPLSADDRREGDDHIRGIKNVLLNTFPGVSAPFTSAGGQWILKDGTVAAPGLAWANELGLGWTRLAPSVVSLVAQGAEVVRTGSQTATQSNLAVYPRAAGVGAVIAAGGPASGTPTKLTMSAGATNGSIIMADTAGASTTLPILYQAGGHQFTGTVTTANQTVTGISDFTNATGGIKFAGITGSFGNTLAFGWDGGHCKMRIDGTTAPSPLAFVADISDIRLKKSVAPLRLGLAAVLDLEPIEYEFDHKLRELLPPGRHYGFSAQDVRKVVPQAVTEADDVLMVNMSQLIPVLVNAVQQLTARVESLEELCAGIGDA